MTHITMQRAIEASGGLEPSELAKLLEVSPQVITNWSNRGIAKLQIFDVAKKLGVTSEWLLTGVEPQQLRTVWDETKEMSRFTHPVLTTDDDIGKKVWLPIKDINFSCGHGESIEFHFEPIDKKNIAFEPDFFMKRNVKPENTVLAYVTGDSMEEYLFAGDVFAMDISDKTIKDGQIYAVYFEGEAMLKEIYKEAGGVLVLHSKNSRYKDKYVNENNGTDFAVIGRQFWRGG